MVDFGYFRSVLKALKFSELKLSGIVILLVNCIPFGFSLFRHFWGIIFIFLIYLLGWLLVFSHSADNVFLEFLH